MATTIGNVIDSATIKRGQSVDLGATIAIKTREGTCACGRPFTQQKLMARWLPTCCDTCVAADKERTRLEDEVRDRAEAKAREMDRRGRALAALDVPLIYLRVTLDTLEPLAMPTAPSSDLVASVPRDRPRQAKVLQLARRYLAMWPERQNLDRLDFPQIVIFTGGPGSGKGHVAWSIVKHVVLEYGDTAVFTVLSDCIRDLREAWNQRRGDGPSESARLRHYRLAGLLVIDEVSQHAFHGEPMQHLYDLVAYREQRLLPTILTTNERDQQAIGALLGPALVSRAAGWSGLWDFGDTDYRALRRQLAREGAASGGTRA